MGRAQVVSGFRPLGGHVIFHTYMIRGIDLRSWSGLGWGSIELVDFKSWGFAGWIYVNGFTRAIYWDMQFFKSGKSGPIPKCLHFTKINCMATRRDQVLFFYY